MAQDTTTRRKGVSLAKGPVAILGLIGIVYGLSALLFASHGFTLHIPHGAVHGKKWIGLEVNGWSDLLFIAAGLLLLLAAPLHWGAKSMSLLVGLVMIAAAVVAVIRGNGVFGIFAANHLTELVWAAAGVLLLVLALLPRVGARDGEDETDERAGVTASRSTVTRDSGVAPEGASRRGSRRVVRRRDTVEAGEVDDQHTRWLQGAEPQDRPLGAGVQSNEDNPSQKETR
jgi:hypothetical protein